MSEYQNIFQTFVEQWGSKSETKKSSDNDIQKLEATFEILLPEEYKYFINQCGDVYCPNLLDTICDNELELSDVQNFFLPDQAIKDTDAYIKAGMPEGYFAFASDCMGNMFCFKIEELKNKSIKPAIWFFDHDYVSMEKISDSFVDWIQKFNTINR